MSDGNSALQSSCTVAAVYLSVPVSVHVEIGVRRGVEGVGVGGGGTCLMAVRNVWQRPTAI